MKSSICTQSHANRNDNRLANTLDKKLPSQNTRNGISEEQDFKTFQRRMLPELPSDSPLRRSRESSIIKRYPDFTYSKGWKSELCFNISYPMVLINIGISACTQASLTHRATVASLDYSVHLRQKNLVSLHCDRITFIHKYIFFYISTLKESRITEENDELNN